MKRLIAVTAVVLAMAGSALAAGTSTVAVSATVLGTCSITGGSAAFGSQNPVVGPFAAAISDPTVTCSNGTPYTITDDDGLYETGLDANRLKDVLAANYIPYTISYTASGTGTGSAVPIGLSASIATLVGATPGVYSDTVTLTVNP